MDVNWNLFERPTYFHLPGYRTGVIDDDWLVPSWAKGGNFGRTLESGTARTDADGALLLEFADIAELECASNPDPGTDRAGRERISRQRPRRDDLCTRQISTSGCALTSGWGKAGRKLVSMSSPQIGMTERQPVEKPCKLNSRQVRWERVDPPPEDTYRNANL